MMRSTVLIFDPAGQPPTRVAGAGEARRLAARRGSSRGLTFIELMFATMILGVGIIIIAAAFPVAIAEQRATLDDAAVAGLERNAVRTLDAAVRQQAPVTTAWLPDTDPATYEIASFGDPNKKDPTNPIWSRIAGDLICRGNERYAWTALYARPPVAVAIPPLPHNVTFFVVTMASREKAAFADADIDSLRPSKVKITYLYKSTSTPTGLSFNPEEDIIKVEDGDANAAQAAVEGAYIIRGVNVRGADGSANVLYPQNAIIKLGTEFKDDELSPNPAPANTFYFRIAPGFEMNAVDAPESSMSGVTAWAVGHAVTIPPTPGNSNRAMTCRAITVSIKPPG